jgi:hypothetical protein
MYGIVSSVVLGARMRVLVGKADGRVRLELRGRVGVQGVLLSWGLAGSTILVERSQEVCSLVNLVTPVGLTAAYHVGVQLELRFQDCCCDVVDETCCAQVGPAGIAVPKEIPT